MYVLLLFFYCYSVAWWWWWCLVVRKSEKIIYTCTYSHVFSLFYYILYVYTTKKNYLLNLSQNILFFQYMSYVYVRVCVCVCSCLFSIYLFFPYYFSSPLILHLFLYYIIFFKWGISNIINNITSLSHMYMGCVCTCEPDVRRNHHQKLSSSSYIIWMFDCVYTHTCRKKNK